MFTKENVARSEIWWVLKTIESKFLLRSYEGTNTLSPEMFPDSKITHSFSLSGIKCNYILNFGLAHFFTTNSHPILQQFLMKAWTKALRKGKWTMLSDEDYKKVNTRYFESTFIDWATATNIQEAFTSGNKELDKKAFLQIVQMDLM